MDLIVSPTGKAHADALETGDIEVTGWAIRFGGVDREGDYFVKGALAAGIDTFLAGSAPLLIQHSPNKQIGKVVEMEEHDEGVSFRAIIPAIPASSPLFHQFKLIQRGMVANTSIGGHFRKAAQRDGRKRIESVDIVELSLTATPMDPRTTAIAEMRIVEDAVLAEKALVERELLDTVLHDLDVIEMRLMVGEIKLATRRRYR